MIDKSEIIEIICCYMSDYKDKLEEVPFHASNNTIYNEKFFEEFIEENKEEIIENYKADYE